MAAIDVTAAQRDGCSLACLGYRVGAPVGYGLRRMMVDESEHPKGFLEKGQFKALQSDRVRLQHGSAEEAAVIRAISSSTAGNLTATSGVN
ncbi:MULTISPECIES: hypothetical protein [unclassified Bradyrhizobium]|uniref:hypothetical protein n=1 Tax=unclassified Bradyrhizobium TaxID=2631580 RepID=UPI001FF91BE6|nr:MULTISPECIES: hypothetical protein [unclassified Bradyrhizobium]MCK1538252.1 hypothetical protein [Bradyrhizobium sp. 176]MCK1560307.1 hypothetical protein [Bradyrhizobium sp. 171]MCK1571748.1 hypothetical protein [Bradyrhizobium sp. 174]UPK00007.1 hypothetical protein IVB07_39120 [Bradyrhizobium sp. 172]